MKSSDMVLPPMVLTVVAALVEAGVIWVVLGVAEEALEVFPVTIVAFFLADAGAHVLLYEGEGSRKATRASMLTAMLTFVIFFATVAAALSQTMENPTVPSSLQWVLCGAGFLVVAGGRSYTREVLR